MESFIGFPQSLVKGNRGTRVLEMGLPVASPVPVVIVSLQILLFRRQISTCCVSKCRVMNRSPPQPGGKEINMTTFTIDQDNSITA